jgi:hypothetical protein
MINSSLVRKADMVKEINRLYKTIQEQSDARSRWMKKYFQQKDENRRLKMALIRVDSLLRIFYARCAGWGDDLTDPREHAMNSITTIRKEMKERVQPNKEIKS